MARVLKLMHLNSSKCNASSAEPETEEQLGTVEKVNDEAAEETAGVHDVDTEAATPGGDGIIHELTEAIAGWAPEYTISEMEDGNYSIGNGVEDDLEFLLKVDPDTGTGRVQVVGFPDESISHSFDATGLDKWMHRTYDMFQDTFDYSLNSSKDNGYLSLDAAASAEERALMTEAVKWAIRPEKVELPSFFRWGRPTYSNPIDGIMLTLFYVSKTRKDPKDPSKPLSVWMIKGPLQYGGTDHQGIPIWEFIPDFDTESRHNRAGGYAQNAKAEERVKSITLRPFLPESKMSYAQQIGTQLATVLQAIVDDCVESPPNRVYDLMLEDGNLKKGNISDLSDRGVQELVTKGVLTGVEALKQKPGIWKWLVNHGHITGEQAYKAEPSDETINYLVKEGYMPVERARKLTENVDEKMLKRMERTGKYDSTKTRTTDVNELFEAVKNGEMTARDAYSLNPAVLNRLLENHLIGRAEAQSLKPGIKKEMNKKGVDWESLDSSADECENPREKMNANRAHRIHRRAVINANRRRRMNSGRLNAALDSQTRYYEQGYGKAGWEYEMEMDAAEIQDVLDVVAKPYGEINVEIEEGGLIAITFYGTSDMASQFWADMDDFGADTVGLMARSDSTDMDEWYDSEDDSFDDFEDRTGWRTPDGKNHDSGYRDDDPDLWRSGTKNTFNAWDADNNKYVGQA